MPRGRRKPNQRVDDQRMMRRAFLHARSAAIKMHVHHEDHQFTKVSRRQGRVQLHRISKTRLDSTWFKSRKLLVDYLWLVGAALCGAPHSLILTRRHASDLLLLSQFCLKVANASRSRYSYDILSDNVYIFPS
jgi:hypothetical protein